MSATLGASFDTRDRRDWEIPFEAVQRLEAQDYDNRGIQLRLCAKKALQVIKDRPKAAKILDLTSRGRISLLILNTVPAATDCGWRRRVIPGHAAGTGLPGGPQSSDPAEGIPTRLAWPCGFGGTRPPGRPARRSSAACNSWSTCRERPPFSLPKNSQAFFPITGPLIIASGAIIVYGNCAVFQKTLERFPAIPWVIHALAERRFEQFVAVLLLQPGLDTRHNRSGLSLTQRQRLRSACSRQKLRRTTNTCKSRWKR